jgi:thiamine biosynthesis lipoprotein
LFRLLSDCIEYSRASGGTFDLTIGPLMRAWGFFGGGRHVPSPDQIREALELVGYRRVQLNARKRTVRFDRPGVEIDPGGVGKGYAVDRMVEVLRTRGIRNALVAASGSSIFGLGNPPEEPRGWPISIADPWDHRKNAAQVFLKDLSLHLGQLREIIPCRRTSLLAHHGSPPWRSGRGRCSGDGHCATRHR